MSKIKVAIIGYGNLGKGVEKAVNQAEDMELVGVFSRRNPETLTTTAAAYHMDQLNTFEDVIDVCILCGGSATDLAVQGPEIAAKFNTVDSFDTHAKIPEYFAALDQVSKAAGKISVISTGWDPGLFSMNRLISEAILPVGDTFTFWGKGVSQGHSDAIRHIEGVADAKQYTIPVDSAMAQVKAGTAHDLTTRDKHVRDCYVVLAEGGDAAFVEKTIKEMPNYFADYNTTVTFVSQEVLDKEHAGLPHGGHVIRNGETSEGTRQVIDFGLELDSNPEFTAAVNVAFARAAYCAHAEGKVGATTVFDFPLGYLSPKSAADLRKELL